MVKLRRLLRNFAFTAGLLLTVALVVIALAAPLLAPFDPNAQDTSRRLEVPSHAHPLGLDDLGRDVLSRIIWGARVSLRVGFSVVIIASIIGIALGSMAGYFGGWMDTIIMRITDILLAFPASSWPSPWWRCSVQVSTMSCSHWQRSAGSVTRVSCAARF
jgi:peptide/nickel transport system permease protein